MAGQAGLQQLVCATGLTKLHVGQLKRVVRCVRGCGFLQLSSVIQIDITATDVGPALQHCSKLVALELNSTKEIVLRPSKPSPLANLSSLTRLQKLHFWWPCRGPADLLPRFPSSITCLILSSTSDTFSVQPAVEAALQQIPQLQHLRSLSLHRTSLDATILISMSQVRELQLHFVEFDPRGLGSMTQLQQLVLEHCSIAKPASSQQLAQAELGDEEVPADSLLETRRADAESLLSAIGQLTQLQVLEVSYDKSEVSVVDVQLRRSFNLETVGLVLRHAPHLAFSAFTASSQLQRLRLDGGPRNHGRCSSIYCNDLVRGSCLGGGYAPPSPRRGGGQANIR
mgnify:CR=1 FL=1